MGMPGNKDKLFVPRVTQLDAVTLDKEINNVLKAQLVNIIQNAQPDILVKWEPEIDALLGFFVWKLSVARNHATFGQQLLGIKYNQSNERKMWTLALILIGGKYALDRGRNLTSANSDEQWSSVASRILHWCRVGVQAASLVNTVLFLGEGKFPTLVDRVLGLRPVPVSENLSRSVGYTYMTRELLWHGFIELLVFVLPLVNYQALCSRVRSIFRRDRNRTFPDALAPCLEVSTLCPVCNETPVLPYHIGCSHVFCAYCLNANVLADPKFECPLCGMPASYCVRQVHL